MLRQILVLHCKYFLGMHGSAYNMQRGLAAAQLLMLSHLDVANDAANFAP